MVNINIFKVVHINLWCIIVCKNLTVIETIIFLTDKLL